MTNNFEKDINVPSKTIIDGVDVSGCDRLNIFPMQYGEPHEICLTSIEQWGGQEKYCKDRPNCYFKQLKRKEQECEELKNFHINLVGVKECEIKELLKLKQTLTEIKSILELYANSKVGEEQPDGTYKLSGGIWDSFGFCTTTYDPRPARQALQKISECEVTNE